MAVDHLCMQWLTHCYRGQAPSHIWISIDQIDLALLLICSCSCPSISEVRSVGARAEPPAAATEETDMYPTPRKTINPPAASAPSPKPPPPPVTATPTYAADSSHAPSPSLR